MKKIIKKYGKGALTLGVAGIGLSAVSGMDSTGSVSKLSGALPKVGSIMGAGMVIESVNYLNKKVKKL